MNKWYGNQGIYFEHYVMQALHSSFVWWQFSQFGQARFRGSWILVLAFYSAFLRSVALIIIVIVVE